MIDIRKLKELVRLMVENELAELDLKDQQETVTIKRGTTGFPVVHHAPVYAPAAVVAGGGAGEVGVTENGSPGGEKAEAADMAGLAAIESPMVGTFYTAANPDSPPFVAAGSSVGPETTVCLIEAMKVFNEIKAEVSGVIERVLVESGKPVEFGQKLFLVKPA